MYRYFWNTEENRINCAFKMFEWSKQQLNDTLGDFYKNTNWLFCVRSIRAFTNFWSLPIWTIKWTTIHFRVMTLLLERVHACNWTSATKFILNNRSLFHIINYNCIKAQAVTLSNTLAKQKLIWCMEFWCGGGSCSE